MNEPTLWHRIVANNINLTTPSPPRETPMLKPLLLAGGLVGLTWFLGSFMHVSVLP